ncbi:MAG: hypothetical protein F4Y99_09495 [Acidimicrobiaceae bacterium]|nr:hypothetical protein [Acidimicrobiaceae bacterium]MYF43637.1 hypothetical protein [Acidimicrobiaceae bacterium]MYJ35433.1 hypothetical protein [Acidimicrobiaceae bacterium]
MDNALEIFQRWIESKQLVLDVISSDHSTSDNCETVVRRASHGDASALQAILTENKYHHGDNERWLTTASWITQKEQGWVWIDIERESDRLFGSEPWIAAPNLAGMLLQARNKSELNEHLGPKPIRIASTDIDHLIESLYDTNRSVPIILFSADPTLSPQKYGQRVQRTAKDLAGCADVRMLTADSEDEFNNALPDVSLKVYRGGVRIYLPGIIKSDPQPFRHRYLLSDRLTDRSRVAAGRVARLVLPRMLAQSPPAIYRTRLKPILDGRDWEQIAVDLDEELNGLKRENQELRLEKAIAYEEATDSEREIGHLLRKNELLRNRLRELSESPETMELSVEESSDPSSCLDAIVLASHLPYIKIHPEAPVDIERLDEAEDGELWARRIWRHLNSLNAYAEAKGPGFLSWCEHSGSDRAISSRCIAMSESQSVMNNPDLRKHRILPIDHVVEPNGCIEMQAHLKPVQGGGMQIPRIYFHDDTKGRTGKVHIGFIGPHDRMPNQSSN